ncbi:MAG: DNA internalization-related competence protein ComEC/Rec2 [Thermoanaerobaculia bacterium]
MKRSWSIDAGSPSVPAVLALMAGILLGLVLPVPPAIALGAALLVLLFGAAVSCFRREPAIARSSLQLLVVCVGFLLGREQVLLPRQRDERRVARLSAEAPVEIVGRVVAPWSASGSLRSTRLKPGSARVNGEDLGLEGEVGLVVAGELDPTATIGLGDLVRVESPLRLPDGPLSARTPFALPPTARMTLKSARMIERLEGPAGPLAPIHRVHRALQSRLRSNLSAADAGERRALSLLEAFLLGDTSDLSTDTASAFRDGGVAHIISISGLHVGLLAALLALGLARLGASVRARDLLVLLATLAFAVFAGGRPPVLRSALMIGLYLLARLVGRPVSLAHVIGLSALFLLLANPANIVDIGFQLTYAAVFGLLVFVAPLAALLQASRVPRFLAGSLGATLGAEIAVFPIQALVFNVVPFVALVSNLVIVPLSGVFLTAGLASVPFLTASATTARIAIVPLRLLADTMLAALALLDRAHAFRLIPTPAFVTVVLLSVGLVIAGLAAKALVRRAFAAAALLLGAGILFQPAVRAAEGTVLFQALDVGQGDAWLLVSSEGRVLVDGGGTIDGTYEFGRLRLVPKLADLGAVSFDTVFLSHPHPDHARGLLGVLNLASVGRLVIPRGAPRNVFLDEVLDAAARRHIAVLRAGAGDRVHAAGLDFAVLHPGPDTYPRARENNGSLVLKTLVAGRTLLLTGDIEAAAEHDLLARGEALSADVLKVAHHGSRTSTGAEFLGAVSPRVAWIGVGRRNHFGHPTREVLDRLAEAHARTFRTDRDGDGSLVFASGRIFPIFALLTPGAVP